MSLSKHWLIKFLVLGLGILLAGPVAAQSVFDDSDPEPEPPKNEWRQKVLQSNKAAQQVARQAPTNTEYLTAQRSSNQNSSRVRTTGTKQAVYTQPKKIRVAQREAPAEVIDDPDATEYEPLATEGVFAPQGDGASCGSDCGDCGDCEECVECCPWMMPFGSGPRNLSIFGGVHGFKGPRDRGVNGNFGFQEGVNLGAPLGDPWGCGYQVGFEALQSNISGYNNTTSTGATADRKQYFFTAGVFRRAECAGWQWGIVFDYMHDDYLQDSNLKQIRSETGYLLNESFEIGYSGAYGVSGDSVNGSYFGRTIDGQLDATDQFVVYFRRYFENGGDGRIWGGMTGYGDGLFGADAWIPLGGSWAMQNSFNYLIPKGGRGSTIGQGGQLDGGQVRESWSVGINLVWYPGRSSNCVGKSCYRPLLNVADNSLFMVRESASITAQ